ncbi:hypothetical protein [Hymenobacter glacieicola]|uniref:Uncharacterized protein n=1 Tax=Hymenobacter glacieicola TaxID=1562124 RepID=A0ABQ1X7G1_9BACT|nr:hypothetical protein [Hymenobacter glacieicola]GGG61128.1 hypothetical protein GCM10011378_41420 [Hymenobacter glacieicola]
MPDRLSSSPRLGGSVPLGRYSTAQQVQSQHLSDRNATAEYLGRFSQDPRGLQEAYGAAINDVPHPVTGQPVSYAALRAEFARNSRPLTESAAYRQGGYKTTDDFLRAQFEAGRKRLMQRAVQQPQVNAFGLPAQGSADAVRRQNFIRETQVVLPDGSPVQVVAADLARRRAMLPTSGQAVAPGFSR